MRCGYPAPTRWWSVATTLLPMTCRRSPWPCSPTASSTRPTTTCRRRGRGSPSSSARYPSRHLRARERARRSGPRRPHRSSPPAPAVTCVPVVSPSRSVVLAVIGGLVSFATDSMPQLAVAIAVLVAVAIDAFTAFRSAGPVELEFSAVPLVTTNDPLSCTVRLIGARRPVVIAPAVRPNVQRFLIDGDEPGLIVLAPRRRGDRAHPVARRVDAGPIGLIECGRRMRVPLGSSITVGPTPLPHDIAWPRPHRSLRSVGVDTDRRRGVPHRSPLRSRWHGRGRALHRGCVHVPAGVGLYSPIGVSDALRDAIQVRTLPASATTASKAS